ncbi:MAG: 2,3-bisphosphoglycerate-independent phosphoglycerate mutase, partial [Peptococcaceae bacterium]|nr:2,3-bisphosphoglycerate-independent phosphoglycerate mutase [Peptococcaceae bacterium]
PHTAHTANPVPFVVVSDRYQTAKNGSLQDVAPTVLKLLGIEKPTDMTGSSLI